MVKFGVAGYPPAFTKSTVGKKRAAIFDWLVGLGLDALELQMTYGPRTSADTCKQFRLLAQETGISLSVHGSYFIVLTSPDPEKIERSIDTLARTYDLTSQLGANAVVLHPGPLYGGSASDALSRFVDNCGLFLERIGNTDVGLFVETAGKTGQLGSLDEILTISAVLPGVHPCVDFGHVHARTLGTLEEHGEIALLVQELQKFYSQYSEKRVHFHYTPIDFGPKGEKQHKALSDQYPEPLQRGLFDASRPGEGSRDGLYHPRPEPVALALRSLKMSYTVISETHNSQEEGARELKRLYQNGL